MNRFTITASAIVALAVVGLIVFFSIFGYTYIEPGEVGIKIDKLGKNREVGPADVVVGRAFYVRWSTGIVKFPVAVQRIEWWGEEALGFNSTEGVGLEADIALSLYVAPDMVPDLYAKYRRSLSQLIDNQVRDKVNGCLIIAAQDMQVDAIIGPQRGEFLATARTCAEDFLAPEGFIINDMTITSPITPPPSIKEQIDAKISAEQEAIAARNRIQRSKAEAESRIEEARGRAESVRLEAQAEAEAIAIQGQALQQNPEVLRLRWLEKWNGILPSVMSGESSSLLLQVDPAR